MADQVQICIKTFSEYEGDGAADRLLGIRQSDEVSISRGAIRSRRPECVKERVKGPRGSYTNMYLARATYNEPEYFCLFKGKMDDSVTVISPTGYIDWKPPVG